MTLTLSMGEYVILFHQVPSGVFMKHSIQHISLSFDLINPWLSLNSLCS